MADNSITPRKKEYSHQIPTHLLNDLSSRFIINVPEEERVDLIRVCFQIELAHWFYLDFYCDEDPKLPKCLLKEFIRIIFGHIPFLQKYYPEVDSVIADWREYKMAVPTFGAIILDKELKNVLLVQSYVAKASWSFPKGKVNKDELPHHCAIREVLEETGFDISHLINKQEYLEHHFNDQLIRLYIISGIPIDSKFHTKTRKEIKSIQWFPVNLLPTGKKDQMCKSTLGPFSFYMVIPFVKQLKKWIALKTTSSQDNMNNMNEFDKYLQQQQYMFAKQSQNELAKYREVKVTNDTNFSEYRNGRFGHKTYSPPPRMLRQRSMKANENEKKKNSHSQTEDRINSKSFRRSLDFTKEAKQSSTIKREPLIPYSKTWANFSLDTESLLATFTMGLRNSDSTVKE